MRLTLPVLVARGLRQEMRRPFFRHRRCGLMVALAVVYTWAIAGPQGPLSLPQRAHQAFLSVSQVALVLCVFAGWRYFAEWPWAEHLDGTRELLLQTEARGWEWLGSGCFTHGLRAANEIAPALPFMALSHSLGGNTLAECGGMLALLWATLAVSSAAGLFGAAFGKNLRGALLTTSLSLFALFAWVPLAFAWIASLLPFANATRWMASPPSPFALFALEGHKNITQTPAWLYAIAAIYGLLGIGWFFIGGRRLAARAWPAPDPAPRGSRRPAAMTWPAWLLLLVIPALFCGLLKSNRIAIGYALAALGTLHLAFKAILAMEAAGRLHTERENGTLALELSANRTVGEIFSRHYQELWHHAKPAMSMLAMGNTFAVLVVTFSPGFTLEEKLLLSAAMAAGIGELWVDARALTWQGLVSGATQPRASQAGLRAMGKVILLPWIAVWGFTLPHAGAYIDPSEIVAWLLCHAVMSIGSSLAWTRSARNRARHGPGGIEAWRRPFAA